MTHPVTLPIPQPLYDADKALTLTVLPSGYSQTHCNIESGPGIARLIELIAWIGDEGLDDSVLDYSLGEGCETVTLNMACEQSAQLVRARWGE